MIKCAKCENWMAEALYGELGQRDSARFDEHLEGCAECAAAYHRFEQTLAIAGRRQLAQADDETLKGFWERLAPQLSRPRREPFLLDWLDRLPSLDWVNRPAVATVTAILLVAAGIFIGRINPGEMGVAQPQMAALLDPAKTADFNARFVNYLDRTKMILLGLDNYELEEDPAEYDLTRHRTISRELLIQGRDLRDHAAIFSQEAAGLLIDDIERILLQLANSDDLDFEVTIQIIQDGMKHNGILFNITLTELSRIQMDHLEVRPKTSSMIAFDGKDSSDG